MSVDDFKARQEAMATIEAAQKQVDEEQKYSDASPKSELENQMKGLDQLERTTGPSGAVPNTPKASLLSIGDLAERNPDKHFRWVNVGNKEKAELRRHGGYDRVPTAEGGKQVGNLALFAMDRREYERRVAHLRKTNQQRLNAHKAEVEQLAENIARELRDRHGISVDAERILINE